MSKVLFINGSVHGHINPTLPLVKELVHRGEEVFTLQLHNLKRRLLLQVLYMLMPVKNSQNLIIITDLPAAIRFMS